MIILVHIGEEGVFECILGANMQYYIRGSPGTGNGVNSHYTLHVIPPPAWRKYILPIKKAYLYIALNAIYTWYNRCNQHE